MRANRQHRYDDYEPDESSVCCDKVRITNIHSCDNQDVGYMSRYNSRQFRFSRVMCGHKFEILDYKDWKIEYIK